LPETRQAVADYLTSLGDKAFSPEDIIMTVGAGGGLNVVLKTILNPGEEVIIPSPYFVEYNFYLFNHQGVPKTVPVKDDMSLDISAIADAVNEKTRAVISSVSTAQTEYHFLILYFFYTE
jgi:aspartate aminotransferase